MSESAALWREKVPEESGRPILSFPTPAGVDPGDGVTVSVWFYARNAHGPLLSEGGLSRGFSLIHLRSESGGHADVRVEARVVGSPPREAQWRLTLTCASTGGSTTVFKGEPRSGLDAGPDGAWGLGWHHVALSLRKTMFQGSGVLWMDGSPVCTVTSGLSVPSGPVRHASFGERLAGALSGASIYAGCLNLRAVQHLHVRGPAGKTLRHGLARSPWPALLPGTLHRRGLLPKYSVDVAGAMPPAAAAADHGDPLGAMWGPVSRTTRAEARVKAAEDHARGRASSVARPRGETRSNLRDEATLGVEAEDPSESIVPAVVAFLDADACPPLSVRRPARMGESAVQRARRRSTVIPEDTHLAVAPLWSSTGAMTTSAVAFRAPRADPATAVSVAAVETAAIPAASGRTSEGGSGGLSLSRRATGLAQLDRGCGSVPLSSVADRCRSTTFVDEAASALLRDENSLHPVLHRSNVPGGGDALSALLRLDAAVRLLRATFRIQDHYHHHNHQSTSPSNAIAPKRASSETTMKKPSDPKLVRASSDSSLSQPIDTPLPTLDVATELEAIAERMQSTAFREEFCALRGPLLVCRSLGRLARATDWRRRRGYNGIAPWSNDGPERVFQAVLRLAHVSRVAHQLHLDTWRSLLSEWRLWTRAPLAIQNVWIRVHLASFTAGTNGRTAPGEWRAARAPWTVQNALDAMAESIAHAAAEVDEIQSMDTPTSKKSKDAAKSKEDPSSKKSTSEDHVNVLWWLACGWSRLLRRQLGRALASGLSGSSAVPAVEDAAADSRDAAAPGAGPGWPLGVAPIPLGPVPPSSVPPRVPTPGSSQGRAVRAVISPHLAAAAKFLASDVHPIARAAAASALRSLLWWEPGGPLLAAALEDEGALMLLAAAVETNHGGRNSKWEGFARAEALRVVAAAVARRAGQQRSRGRGGTGSSLARDPPPGRSMSMPSAIRPDTDANDHAGILGPLLRAVRAALGTNLAGVENDNLWRITALKSSSSTPRPASRELVAGMLLGALEVVAGRPAPESSPAATPTQLSRASLPARPPSAIPAEGPSRAALIWGASDDGPREDMWAMVRDVGPVPGKQPYSTALTLPGSDWPVAVPQALPILFAAADAACAHTDIPSDSVFEGLVAMLSGRDSQAALLSQHGWPRWFLRYLADDGSAPRRDDSVQQSAWAALVGAASRALVLPGGWRAWETLGRAMRRRWNDPATALDVLSRCMCAALEAAERPSDAATVAIFRENIMALVDAVPRLWKDNQAVTEALLEHVYRLRRRRPLTGEKEVMPVLHLIEASLPGAMQIEIARWQGELSVFEGGSAQSGAEALLNLMQEIFVEELGPLQTAASEADKERAEGYGLRGEDAQRRALLMCLGVLRSSTVPLATAVRRGQREAAERGDEPEPAPTALAIAAALAGAALDNMRLGPELEERIAELRPTLDADEEIARTTRTRAAAALGAWQRPAAILACIGDAIDTATTTARRRSKLLGEVTPLDRLSIPPKEQDPIPEKSLEDVQEEAPEEDKIASNVEEVDSRDLDAQSSTSREEDPTEENPKEEKPQTEEPSDKDPKQQKSSDRPDTAFPSAPVAAAAPPVPPQVAGSLSVDSLVREESIGPSSPVAVIRRASSSSEPGGMGGVGFSWRGHGLSPGAQIAASLAAASPSGGLHPLEGEARGMRRGADGEWGSWVASLAASERVRRRESHAKWAAAGALIGRQWRSTALHVGSGELMSILLAHAAAMRRAVDMALAVVASGTGKSPKAIAGGGSDALDLELWRSAAFHRTPGWARGWHSGALVTREGLYWALGLRVPRMAANGLYIAGHRLARGPWTVCAHSDPTGSQLRLEREPAPPLDAQPYTSSQGRSIEQPEFSDDAMAAMAAALVEEADDDEEDVGGQQLEVATQSEDADEISMQDSPSVSTQSRGRAGTGGSIDTADVLDAAISSRMGMIAPVQSGDDEDGHGPSGRSSSIVGRAAAADPERAGSVLPTVARLLDPSRRKKRVLHAPCAFVRPSGLVRGTLTLTRDGLFVWVPLDSEVRRLALVRKRLRVERARRNLLRGGTGASSHTPKAVEPPGRASHDHAPVEVAALPWSPEDDASGAEPAPVAKARLWAAGEVRGLWLRFFRHQPCALAMHISPGAGATREELLLVFPGGQAPRDAVARAAIPLLAPDAMYQAPSRWTGGGEASAAAAAAGAPTRATGLHFPPHQVSRWYFNRSGATEAWQSRRISNLEYICILNRFAGRGTSDWTQFPVFPWVLASLGVSRSRFYEYFRQPLAPLRNLDGKDPEEGEEEEAMEGPKAGRAFDEITERLLRLTAAGVADPMLAAVSSAAVDLASPASFRDLRRPVGALLRDRLERFRSAYAELSEMRKSAMEMGDDAPGGAAAMLPPRLYGSHYSTEVGTVLHFLVRSSPAAALHTETQGGNFDVADRLCADAGAAWLSAVTNAAEVKEITPEFFGAGLGGHEVFLNRQGLAMGLRQDGRVVDHVRLPPWADPKGFTHPPAGPVVDPSAPEPSRAPLRDPRRLAVAAEAAATFARLNRAALESEYVSQRLHHWVDLVFGCRQRGDAAVAGDNVFERLTYVGAVDWNAPSLRNDPRMRRATAEQIGHYGQCPPQLLRKAHPQRGPPPAKPTVARPLADDLRSGATAACAAAGVPHRGIHEAGQPLPSWHRFVPPASNPTPSPSPSPSPSPTEKPEPKPPTPDKFESSPPPSTAPETPAWTQGLSALVCHRFTRVGVSERGGFSAWRPVIGDSLDLEAEAKAENAKERGKRMRRMQKMHRRVRRALKAAAGRELSDEGEPIAPFPRGVRRSRRAYFRLADAVVRGSSAPPSSLVLCFDADEAGKWDHDTMPDLFYRSSSSSSSSSNPPAPLAWPTGWKCQLHFSEPTQDRPSQAAVSAPGRVAARKAPPGHVVAPPPPLVRGPSEEIAAGAASPDFQAPPRPTDLFFWSPLAPKGYKALGCLITSDPTPPCSGALVCVHESLLIPAPLRSSIPVTVAPGRSANKRPAAPPSGAGTSSSSSGGAAGSSSSAVAAPAPRQSVFGGIWGVVGSVVAETTDFVMGENDAADLDMGVADDDLQDVRLLGAATERMLHATSVSAIWFVDGPIASCIVPGAEQLHEVILRSFENGALPPGVTVEEAIAAIKHSGKRQSKHKTIAEQDEGNDERDSDEESSDEGVDTTEKSKAVGSDDWQVPSAEEVEDAKEDVEWEKKRAAVKDGLGPFRRGCPEWCDQRLWDSFLAARATSFTLLPSLLDKIQANPSAAWLPSIEDSRLRDTSESAAVGPAEESEEEIERKHAPVPSPWGSAMAPTTLETSIVAVQVRTGGSVLAVDDTGAVDFLLAQAIPQPLGEPMWEGGLEVDDESEKESEMEDEEGWDVVRTPAGAAVRDPFGSALQRAAAASDPRSSLGSLVVPAEMSESEAAEACPSSTPWMAMVFHRDDRAVDASSMSSVSAEAAKRALERVGLGGGRDSAHLGVPLAAADPVAARSFATGRPLSTPAPSAVAIDGSGTLLVTGDAPGWRGAAGADVALCAGDCRSGGRGGEVHFRQVAGSGELGAWSSAASLPFLERRPTSTWVSRDARLVLVGLDDGSAAVWSIRGADSAVEYPWLSRRPRAVLPGLSSVAAAAFLAQCQARERSIPRPRPKEGPAWLGFEPMDGEDDGALLDAEDAEEEGQGDDGAVLQELDLADVSFACLALDRPSAVAANSARVVQSTEPESLRDVTETTPLAATARVEEAVLRLWGILSTNPHEGDHHEEKVPHSKSSGGTPPKSKGSASAIPHSTESLPIFSKKSPTSHIPCAPPVTCLAASEGYDLAAIGYPGGAGVLVSELSSGRSIAHIPLTSEDYREAPASDGASKERRPIPLDCRALAFADESRLLVAAAYGGPRGFREANQEHVSEGEVVPPSDCPPHSWLLSVRPSAAHDAPAASRRLDGCVILTMELLPSPHRPGQGASDGQFLAGAASAAGSVLGAVSRTVGSAASAAAAVSRPGATDGDVVFTGDDRGGIRAFDARTLFPLLQLRGTTAGPARTLPVYSLSFSPCGGYLVAGCGDGALIAHALPGLASVAGSSDSTVLSVSAQIAGAVAKAGLIHARETVGAPIFAAVESGAAGVARTLGGVWRSFGWSSSSSSTPKK